MSDLVKSMKNKYKMYPSHSLEWKIIAEVERLRSDKEKLMDTVAEEGIEVFSESD